MNGGLRASFLSGLAVLAAILLSAGPAQAKVDVPAEIECLALNIYFEAVVTAVGEAGGDVLKFIGDGMLAVFPVTDDSTVPERCRDATAAVAAARTALAQVNEKRPELWLDGPLDFTAALHVGPVVYGNIGGAERLDFTVIGPAVNTASRLETLCRPLESPVLATAAVARHVPDMARSLGERSLPGIAGPVEVFALSPGQVPSRG